MKSDPIADLLTRIRNASRAEHEKADIPSSRLKVRVCEILKDEGFIKNFRILDDKKQGTLRVYLKYGPQNEKVISGLVRVSKPGRRVYSKIKELPKFYNGLGISILSTPRGVMSDHEARQANVGGEVLCHVW
jgi:small subunit ribosomal protein S8